MSTPVVIYQSVAGQKRGQWHIVRQVLDGRTYGQPTEFYVTPLCRVSGSPLPVVPTSSLSSVPAGETVCFGCLREALIDGRVTITIHESLSEEP